MPPKLIGPLKKDSENRLETTAVLNAGTAVIGDIDRVATVGQIEHLGSIANTTFNQGAVSDHGRWMQGLDYPSTLRYVRVNSEGKLETVGIIESGTIGEVGRVGTVGNISDIGRIGTIGDIGRIGTIGDIDHLGSIANTSFDQGSVSDHKREMYMRQLGTWIPVEGDLDENLKTVSVLQHGTASIGDVNTVATVGHVDSLGTVERVKDIDYLGTVGRLETIGMVESGTISEVGRVGTVGDIEHLGSIGNTKFNQGSLDDHDRWIKGDDVGTKRYVKVDSTGKLKTVTLIESGTATIGDIRRVGTVGNISDIGRVGTIGDINHLGSIANVSFDQGSVTDHKRHMYINEYGTWVPLQGTYSRLKTVSVLEASTAVIGDVRRVGTVGVIDHLGSIANTMFDAGRVGTIGDIEHLGSIANTSFDQGAVSDHERHMHIKQYGTWQFLQGTANCAYVVPLMDRSGVLIPFDSSPNAELRVAIGYNGSVFTAIRLDASNRLQHAPATTRKGGKKLVTNMGTAVALVGPSTPCISLIVKALHTNAGEIYVGDSTVGSATGYILQKDEFVSFSADDVNGVYIDRNAGTQGVSFLYTNY